MSMHNSLSGQKVAILAANGFQEQDVTETQRKLLEAGAQVHIVSSDHGLVNSWTGDRWGHHFSVDVHLSQALAADYDMLVIPGGMRSFDKLKLTAHTKRFIGGFMMAQKPVAVMHDALHLMVFCDQVRGRRVSGPMEMESLILQAGGDYSDASPVTDGHLMTGVCDAEKREDYISRMMDFFVSCATHQENREVA